MTIENNNDNEAQTAEQKSNDAKLILAPLAKYAAVAVIMVSIIITTVIMLDRDLNPIDRNIASLKAELAEINATETNKISEIAVDTESLVADATTAEEIDKGSQAVATAAESATTVEISAPVEATQTQQNNTETSTTATLEVEVVAKAEDPATALAQTTEQIATSSPQADADQAPSLAAARNTASASRIDSLKASRQARIADRNSYLDTLDTKSLEDFKASQQKMIERMRRQITRQQDIIEQMRARNQDAYEMRAASIKRMQDARDRSLERI